MCGDGSEPIRLAQAGLWQWNQADGVIVQAALAALHCVVAVPGAFGVNRIVVEPTMSAEVRAAVGPVHACGVGAAMVILAWKAVRAMFM